MIPVCSIHTSTQLIVEEGGSDKPSVHGRIYCPRCEIDFNAALDAAEAQYSGALEQLKDL